MNAPQSAALIASGVLRHLPVNERAYFALTPDADENDASRWLCAACARSAGLTRRGSVGVVHLRAPSACSGCAAPLGAVLATRPRWTPDAVPSASRREDGDICDDCGGALRYRDGHQWHYGRCAPVWR